MLEWLMLAPLVLSFAVFPLGAALVLRLGRGPDATARMLALWGIAVCLALSALGGVRTARLHQAGRFAVQAAASFGFYLAFVAIHYAMLRRWARRGDAWSRAPLLFPVLWLVLVKYTTPAWLPWYGTAGAALLLHLVGISYMAFRLSHLTMEVRNGVVEMPDPGRYFAFAFWAPTFAVGPISPYSRFVKSLATAPAPRATARECAARLLVGFTKYLFLASLCSQLAYTGLLLDGHRHLVIDLVIAAFAYFFFLYLNFSGYCDMAIAVSAWVGIDVAENFQEPLSARNLQEFWNRWHITLSGVVRDMLFSPLAMSLTRRWGPDAAHHAIGATILISFILIGIWHGVGWNFAAYGLSHGLAVAGVHYYTIFLKKRLGRDGYRAYVKNPYILWAARAATLSFCAASVFLFANDWPQAEAIFQILE